MKKIIALCLCFIMILCCGCSGTKETKTPSAAKPKKTTVQYVIALNPSLAFEDGAVLSVRNSAAKSMQADNTAGTTSDFYENTPWRWVRHSADGEWDVRLLRSLTLWSDASLQSNSSSPYAYTLTDAPTTSLAVFDSSKMNIKGCNESDLPQSGVMMSFTGDEEEVLLYTAENDCIVELADRNAGNIAIVSSVGETDTSFLNKEGAKKAIVLRIYKNNRIYWQQILDSSSTAVAFPTFSNLELAAGDHIMITAQAVDDTSAITPGNCDIPGGTVTVMESVKETVPTTVINKVPVTSKVKVEKVTGVPVINDDGESTFKVVRSKDANDSQIALLSELSYQMSKKLGVSVSFGNDELDPGPEDYVILLGDTRFAESQKAISEIKAARKANASDFIIRLVGKKLIIAATTDIGMEFAMEFFVNNYCKDEDSEIPINLNYVSSNYNSVKNINIMGKPISDYRIVVSHCASFIETSAAEHLAKEIAKSTGVYLTTIRDDEAKARANEILIGDTNRANYRNVSEYSKVANASVDNKYRIEAKNNTLSVLGSQIYGVNAGAIKLASLISSGTVINNGYKYNGEYDGEYTLTDGYKLTWADEFNADKLSRTWKFTTDINANDLGGNNIYKKDSNYLKDGALIQEVVKSGNDFYNAGITTEGPEKMNFMWGYLEIRVKFSKTTGFCSSFWTKASVVGGFLESDIYETFGNPFNVKHNLHTWETGKHLNLMGGTGSILNYSPGVAKPEPYGEEYHTVGWEWSDDRSNFYVDGQLTATFDSTSSQFDIFNKPCWLIIDATAGTSSYTSYKLPDNFVSDSVSYDYVHIYQKNDGSVMYVKQ